VSVPQTYPSGPDVGRGDGVWRLEAMNLLERKTWSAKIVNKKKTESKNTDLDGVRGKIQPLLLVGEELLDRVTVIALKLDHLAGFVIVDNGAVAMEVLLEGLDNLLQVESGRDPFNSSQGLATIALYVLHHQCTVTLFCVFHKGVDSR
jgi:hypothetical protein